jgi:hypothetical protein
MIAVARAKPSLPISEEGKKENQPMNRHDRRAACRIGIPAGMPEWVQEIMGRTFQASPEGPGWR